MYVVCQSVISTQLRIPVSGVKTIASQRKTMLVRVCKNLDKYHFGLQIKKINPRYL